MTNLEFKRVLRWSKSERMLRLFRVLWLVRGAPGAGYSVKLSAALHIVPGKVCVGVVVTTVEPYERTVWLYLLPCVAIRFHYDRSYGGRFV